MSFVLQMSVTCGTCTYKDVTLERMLMHTYKKHPHKKLHMNHVDKQKTVGLLYDILAKELEKKHVI